MAVVEMNQASQQTWKLPRADQCRALRFGLGDNIIYCLVAESPDCGYALRFGSSFLCLHPKRGEIATRTERRSART